MQILNELLDNITIGDPQVFEEVQVFPLFSSSSESPVSFLQLDEALDQGLAEITEVSDGGSVPQLRRCRFQSRVLSRDAGAIPAQAFRHQIAFPIPACESQPTAA
jgi:hypothetical protein